MEPSSSSSLIRLAASISAITSLVGAASPALGAVQVTPVKYVAAAIAIIPPAPAESVTGTDSDPLIAPELLIVRSKFRILVGFRAEFICWASKKFTHPQNQSSTEVIPESVPPAPFVKAAICNNCISTFQLSHMPGSRTTRVTGGYGTQSNERGENWETPQDASDILGLETEIGGRSGGPSRRPPMGGRDIGKGIDLTENRGPDLTKPGSTPARPGIGLGIGKSEAGNLGISVEVPIPVPAPISARGKIAIDPATGKIRGGGLGLGLGKGPIGIAIDIGIDTPPGSDKLGCFKYATVTVAFFSHTFGKNECEPKPQKEIPIPPGATLPPKKPPSIVGCGYYAIFFADINFIGDWQTSLPPLQRVARVLCREVLVIPESPSYNYDFTYFENFQKKLWGNVPDSYSLVAGYGGLYGRPEGAPAYGGYNANYTYEGSATFTVNYSMEVWGTGGPGHPLSDNCKKLLLPTDSPSPSSPPPIPNPQPTKKKMEDCCEITKALQLETLRMLGRQVVNGKLVPISLPTKGFIGEEIERIETPIKNATKPTKIKIKFNSIYELLIYSLRQANNLDTALDPQSYKPPTGYLQNPKYSRDTETSLTKNNQPGTDKSGNKREFKINTDEEAKFSGFIQQQSYLFEAIKRLEYLFPSGELDDAKIAKGLLIPGQEGEIKIHNMIQAYELQMQYLNAILGNPREEVIVKDANPAIKGDQPMKFKALSISELMRESIKFQIDTAGDLDALVNMSLRNFRTTLANRITNIQIAEMTTALFEDSGMIEDQDYIKVNLEGDPYAGQWVKGKGFEPNPELDKNTEEATEKILEATLKNFTIKIKVSRRDKREKTDMRDLLRGLADFIQRLLSVPASGDAINKLVKDAKFKVQTDMALLRENVKQAATASRNRTRKRKK